jgi:uncharacterized protein YegJ (DUF2314 family)
MTKDEDSGEKPFPWDQEEWPWGEDSSADFHWAIFHSDMSQTLCAQASFVEFARAVEYERFRVVPTYEAIGIKAFFSVPNAPMAGEHIFLTNVFTDGKMVTATLNADARMRDDLKEGQDVTFSIKRVSDWFLVRAGRGLGGFTIPYVWNKLPPVERVQYKNEPPFVWFSHRGTQTATDELLGLRKCSQCNMRDIGYPENTASVCGICSSGSRRCACSKCGAPLIRNDKLPELCARCFKRDRRTMG